VHYRQLFGISSFDRLSNLTAVPENFETNVIFFDRCPKMDLAKFGCLGAKQRAFLASLPAASASLFLVVRTAWHPGLRIRRLAELERISGTLLVA
jgi:hypothetical protein